MHILTKLYTFLAGKGTWYELFLPKIWGQKQSDTLFTYANNSDGAVRPTSNIKIKVALCLTLFYSILNQFFRCA